MCKQLYDLPLHRLAVYINNNDPMVAVNRESQEPEFKVAKMFVDMNDSEKYYVQVVKLNEKSLSTPKVCDFEWLKENYTLETK